MKQRIVFILTLLLCVNVAQAQNRYEEYNNIINGNAGMPGVVDLIADGKYLRAYYRLNSIVNNHYAMPSPPTEFNKYMKMVTEKIADEVVAGRMDRSNEDIMAAVRRAANEFKYGPAVSLIGGNNNGNNTGGGSSTAQRQTFTANGVSFTMIRVEGNGSPYYIGETEVTQALWQAVMGSLPSDISSSSYDVHGINRPVCYVKCGDCDQFIRKLNSITGKNFRLPSESEWEYAAKGGKYTHDYEYSGSNTIDDVAWYTSNTNNKGSRDVKTKRPNELGIYDMTGNVCEWTSTMSGSYRVNRGGGWRSGAGDCTFTLRYTYAPAVRLSSLGLRLAL